MLSNVTPFCAKGKFPNIRSDNSLFTSYVRVGVRDGYIVVCAKPNRHEWLCIDSASRAYFKSMKPVKNRRIALTKTQFIFARKNQNFLLNLFSWLGIHFFKDSIPNYQTYTSSFRVHTPTLPHTEISLFRINGKEHAECFFFFLLFISQSCELGELANGNVEPELNSNSNQKELKKGKSL